ncbi:MAG: S8 family serine peptidase, partial [Anaerolineae bacterium]|nr:S8 family serine peptidase [Anaerolineae bacterium]
ARAVQAEYKPRLDALARAVQTADGTLSAQAQRPTLATREEEIAYAQHAAARLTAAEAKEAHAQAVSALEATQREMRREILARSAATRQASQGAVAKAVEDLGGEVIYRYDTINAMAVAISLEGQAVLAAHPDVAAILEDKLMQGGMNISAEAIGANTWWGLGYAGGIWDVAVIDSGIDDAHPALSSQNSIENRCLAAADYGESGMPGWDPTADDVNGHGTHIAGTIASTDGFYRGIAHGLDVLINGKAGYDGDGNDGGGCWMYWSDGMACTDWALNNATDDADVINLSYGGIASSDDGGFERFWDAVVDQMDAVVTMSAGNNNVNGSPTIHSPSIAYNVISVANVDDHNTIVRSDDSIYSSSSRGPTPGGRKKPDLAAPGSAIYSANNNWEGANPDYVNYWGTSMAAPHVAGAAALIMDRGVSNPMAIKALLINTAEDKGSTGWDNAYGWGYIDLNHLDSHVNDYFAGAIAPSPAYRFYAGPAYIGDTATLVWHRRAVYSGDSYPSTYYTLTDLDLYLYNEDNNVAIDSSLSGIDNVEPVEADGSYGSVVVKVDAWSGTISGASTEDYVLATGENFVAKDGPTLQIVITTVTGDTEGPAGTIINISARVQNTGDLRAHNVYLNATYSAGLTKDSGSDSNYIGSLDDGALSGIYSWQFTKNSDDPQVIELDATSSSYDESFADSWRLGGSTTYLPIILKNY